MVVVIIAVVMVIAVMRLIAMIDVVMIAGTATKTVITNENIKNTLFLTV